MSIVPTPKRGEIWVVNFNPAVGSEIRKLRPALVMNRDDVGRLPLRIVVPITDWKPQFVSIQWFVMLSAGAATGLIKQSAADVFQTKSVSLNRFFRRLGTVDAATVEEVAYVIADSVGAI